MSGTLSNQRIGWKQVPQRELGQSRLFSSGSRAMATLRKLPTHAPTTNTKISDNANAMLEVYENSRVIWQTGVLIDRLAVSRESSRETAKRASIALVSNQCCDSINH